MLREAGQAAWLSYRRVALGVILFAQQRGFTGKVSACNALKGAVADLVSDGLSKSKSCYLSRLAHIWLFISL